MSILCNVDSFVVLLILSAIFMKVFLFYINLCLKKKTTIKTIAIGIIITIVMIIIIIIAIVMSSLFENNWLPRLTY